MASASDPAQNPYYKRDARRQYPQLSVITQEHLSKVILGVPATEAYVTLPFWSIWAISQLAF